MAHEIETMAFANQVPWHGLGNRVDPTVSIEEMLVAAGLDWEVNMKPCYAWDDATSTAIPIGRKALVRSTDNKILTVTGELWQPLQNSDMLEFFRDFTDAGGATLETAGSLRGGKVVWGLASLNDQFELNGDVVKGYLLIISPHEVGKSITVRTTTVRVVCANTMALAERGIPAYRQHHLKEFDFAKAKEVIGLSRVQLGNAKLEAEALSNLQMSEFESVRFLARFFQPGANEIIKTEGEEAFDGFVESLLNNATAQSKSLEGVIHSYNNAPGAQPGTGWGVLNGVTHWCDHVAGREADARMFNSWLGERSRAKLKVNSELLKLAGVA